MAELDAALEEIWEATEVSEAPAAFSAAVLERMARRRAWRELVIAAVIATGVWAVSFAFSGALGAASGAMSAIAGEEAVMASLLVIAVGLGVFAALRARRQVERGFWTLGLMR